MAGQAVREYWPQKNNQQKTMVFEAVACWDDFCTLARHRWEQRHEKIGLVDARRNRGPSNLRRRRRIILDDADQNNDEDYSCWLGPVVCIPLAELPTRRFELPTRSVSFGILVSNVVELEVVRTLLCTGSKSSWGAGGTTIWGIIIRVDDDEEENDNDDDEGIRPRRQQQLADDGDPAAAAAAANDSSARSTIPLPRLWRPDPMVETILLPLLKTNLLSQQHNSSRSSSSSNDGNDPGPHMIVPTLQVLDVGSGVGRDLCFLSEELHGAFGNDDDNDNYDDRLRLDFVGIDQRYRDGNDETMAFWRRRGQSDRCRGLCVDLRQNNNIHDVLVDQQQQQQQQLNGDGATTTSIIICCVYAVRYWHEPLFALLAVQLTRPGTIIAISHFAKPNDEYVWDHATPKVRRRMILSVGPPEKNEEEKV
jgi:hypothetical protein